MTMPAAVEKALEALRTARTTLVLHGDQASRPVIAAIDYFVSGQDFASALGLANGWHSAFCRCECERSLRALEERYFAELETRWARS